MAEGWQRGTVTLRWPEGHEFHGLWIEMRRRPLGKIIDEWLASDDDAAAGVTLSREQIIQERKDNAADFAKLVIAWNLLDDEEQPVPITGDGVLSVCDQPMITAMWRAYNEVTTRVAPPLSASSNGGPVAPTPPSSEWDLGNLQETNSPG